MNFVRYVLMVVTDPAGKLAVGLTKLKGPKHLLNKLTFPGGKMEEGETVVQASSREMVQETGLVIPESAWHVLKVVTGDDYELNVVAAETTQVSSARTMEEEPVWVLGITEHLATARGQPHLYSPDFIEFLEMALERSKR
ncbi:NUDIX domain-containing protein [Nostoc sp. CHAB 5834]|nr:NUDIX domain-containing protein [Nostoc sp. CHAB 5834]